MGNLCTSISILLWTHIFSLSKKNKTGGWDIPFHTYLLKINHRFSFLSLIHLFSILSAPNIWLKNKQKNVKERKAVLFPTIWIVKFSLPIHWKEFSHLPVAQKGLLHYAKTLYAANSSIIYTFIVHYPNHLSPWEFQKFSYASLIHSRYTNLNVVSKKEKKYRIKNNCTY